jgi:hypothetical protein
VKSRKNSENRLRHKGKSEVLKSRDQNMTVYDMFIKFQNYRLSVSTVCKEQDSYFKDVRSGTPVYSWVIVNRRHVIFETKNLILKRNYQTQGINMSLKQETISAKARLLFN